MWVDGWVAYRQWVAMDVGEQVLETKCWPTAMEIPEFNSNGPTLKKDNSINNEHFCTNGFDELTPWVETLQMHTCFARFALKAHLCKAGLFKAYCNPSINEFLYE